MTTTELIKILQDNEKGGISHKPRNISLSINGRYMPDPQISLSSTGDGICGPEIDLDIEGEWFEQQPNRCDSCTHYKEQDGSNCYECVKGMADNFEAHPTDAAEGTRDCKTCIHSDKGNCAYTEECHECMWESKYEQQPSEDCISRRAVLDVIKFEDEWLFDAKSHNADTKIAFSAIKSKISELPPVTPKGVTVTDFADKCKECGKIQNELSKDAVSREQVVEITFQEPSYTDPYNILTEVREKVGALPSVTPQRPKGKWIDTGCDGQYECSNCNCLWQDSEENPYSDWIEIAHYCPNCGAKMEAHDE